MASPSSAKVIELRQLLEEQRQARIEALPPAWHWGDSQLDSLQIPQAALTEIVADPFLLPGGAFLLHRVLQLALPQQRVVLIDGQNAFDPQGLSHPLLNRLLWLRCPDALTAMKAADLVLRDGNISLAILLFLLNSPKELKKIHPQSWHRLQLLAEKSAVTFLAFTPSAQIGSARLRISLESSFSLTALDLNQNELRSRLHLEKVRSRFSMHLPSAKPTTFSSDKNRVAYA